MYVIKLGGSAITIKSEPFTPRLEVIKRIPEEIEPALPKLVLVHGAGSFGHQIASEYKIHEGFKAKPQLIAASFLKRKMSELTHLVQDSLLEAGIPVFPFHPSSFMIFEDGRPIERNIEPLKGFFKVGLIPLIPPDGAFDIKRGFSIVSGDLSSAIVAQELSASALIFGMDVDGLILEGELVEHLTPEEAREIAKRLEASDVSGGIRGKLLISAEVAEAGIPVYLVNLLEPYRLRKLLEGEKVPATIITS